MCGNEVYLLRTGAETVASDAIIPTVLQKLARKLSRSLTNAAIVNLFNFRTGFRVS